MGWNGSVGCFIYDGVNGGFLLQQGGTTAGYLKTRNNVLDNGSGGMTVASLSAAGIVLAGASSLLYSEQLSIRDSANSNYQLNLGASAAGGYGVVQAIETGSAVIPLKLNPNGGGCSTQFNALDDGSGNTNVNTLTVRAASGQITGPNGTLSLPSTSGAVGRSLAMALDYLVLFGQATSGPVNNVYTVSSWTTGPSSSTASTSIGVSGANITLINGGTFLIQGNWWSSSSILDRCTVAADWSGQHLDDDRSDREPMEWVRVNQGGNVGCVPLMGVFNISTSNQTFTVTTNGANPLICSSGGSGGYGPTLIIQQLAF